MVLIFQKLLKRHQRLLKEYGCLGRFFLISSIILIVIGSVFTIGFFCKVSNLFSVVDNIKDIDRAGTTMISSFFGGIIGPIFSLVGIFLLITSLRFQSKSLDESRRNISVQQFENIFFNLMKIQQETRNNVEGSFNIDGLEINAKGISFFQKSLQHIKFNYEHLKQALSSEKNNNSTFKNKMILNIYKLEWEKVADPSYSYKVIYRDWYVKRGYVLGSYFRHLYHILKFLKANEVRETENLSDLGEIDNVNRKYKSYADLLQAQLSTPELFLIFYNGIFFSDTTKQLLDHFQFLENLSKDELLDSFEHPKLYSSIQFKSGLEIFEL